MDEQVRPPEPNTTVHFCLVGEGIHIMCAPAIILKVEDGSELGPNEEPRPHMVHLALIAQDGRRVVFSGIGYAPLSAPDLSGSWHYKSEHADQEG